MLSKPAGLLSQGDKSGEPDLVSGLRKYLGRHYVGLIHRLDRNISGAMLIAKRTKAARRLTKDLQEGKIFRTYIGFVSGHLKKIERWQHYLLKDREKNEVKVVSDGCQGALKAILSVKPLKNYTHTTKVEFILETGRSHQIRIQCLYEKHPIIGDPKYGIKNSIPFHSISFPRPALHSFSLSFPHPMSGETLKFEAPLPEDLRKLERELV